WFPSFASVCALLIGMSFRCNIGGCGKGAFQPACKPKFSAAELEGYQARPSCNGSRHGKSPDCVSPRILGRVREGPRSATDENRKTSSSDGNDDYDGHGGGKPVISDTRASACTANQETGDDIRINLADMHRQLFGNVAILCR